MFENFIQEYKNKIQYFNYSKRTEEVYSHYFEKFLINVNKYPQHITSKDFENYLFNFKFSSVSQQNQIINALKFGYEKVLNKKYSKVDFERPRKEKTLPKIIEKDFLLYRINKIQNIKHKAILSLAYSVGLRVSEVINLKIKDVDSRRMVISIINAKGKKDRIVPLTDNILSILRNYYSEYKPKEYLFNGQFSNKYSPNSCNKLVKKYIGDNYHFHLLRHSCFTNLIEQNVDLRIIQKLAGHDSSKTTEIYTHVSKNTLSRLPLAI